MNEIVLLGGLVTEIASGGRWLIVYAFFYCLTQVNVIHSCQVIYHCTPGQKQNKTKQKTFSYGEVIPTFEITL